jgi:riboflavin kinase/FMN adenylyltransferase
MFDFDVYFSKKMEIVNDIFSLGKIGKAALSIGVFDGVHIGHRKILSSMQGEAKCKGFKVDGCYLCVLTFKNHPRWLGKEELYPKLISPPYYKLEVFEKEYNIDKVIYTKFTPEFRDIEPERFLEILKSQIDELHIFVGYNFKFGKGAKGNTDFLIRNASKFGYVPHIADEVMYKGIRVSSTVIRSFIAQGDIEIANELLTRRFFLESKVIKGAGRGKAIGFPTANIRSRIQVYPPPGIYGTITEVDGKKYKSVTHVGSSPTFGGNPFDVETHIINFEGDLYNKRIRVYFDRFLGDSRFTHGIDEVREVIKHFVELWEKEDVKL